ncbi:MAG TPA: hypothetical protein PLP39_01620 [Flavobacterium lutivivi]|nr:hypothetical protein [Flavobacterium lutivivi]
MCEIIVNVIGTIIGGLLLTLILFLLNEYAFPKINLTGEWKTIISIKKTTYNPFKDLKVEYAIHLIQKGYELSGSGEKIKDIKPDGSETVFIREKRVLVDIEGYFERKYFGKSKVYLNISEEGRKRETRATYILEFNHNNNLSGVFKSTAGDASGIISMNKTWLKQ